MKSIEIYFRCFDHTLACAKQTEKETKQKQREKQSIPKWNGNCLLFVSFFNFYFRFFLCSFRSSHFAIISNCCFRFGSFCCISSSCVCVLILSCFFFFLLPCSNRSKHENNGRYLPLTTCGKIAQFIRFCSPEDTNDRSFWCEVCSHCISRAPQCTHTIHLPAPNWIEIHRFTAMQIETRWQRKSILHK